MPPAPEPLPVPVADNHLHLDHARDGEQRVEVGDAVARAGAVGVDRFVQIGCDLPGARFTVDVVQRHAAVLGGVALHPNEAPRLATRGQLDAALEEIERLARHPRVRVVGETGLDYYRTGAEGLPAQHDAFRWHIDLAKRTGKVLQVHDREAHGDVLRILAEEEAPERTVLHCFSGDAAVARAAVGRGYVLSFAGTVTFRNATTLREALAVAPLEQLQVETDAPYLAPHPWRGATNASYLVPITVRAIAAARGVDLTALCEALSATAERLYGPWSV